MRSSIKSIYALNERGRSTFLNNRLFPPAGEVSAKERVFMVCHGIGEPERAELAVEILSRHFYDYFTRVSPFKGEKLSQIYLNDVLRYVERKLQQQDNPSIAGTESTIALAYFNENGSVTLAWVGNCRIYHIRAGQVLYRTEDHLTNIWQNGRSLSIPRAISGNEPVWASVSVLNDVQPNDYLLLCSPEVHETLDDRNIKYLFAQSDGHDATNQAIINKIRETCDTHAKGSYSAYLLQLDQTPFTSALTSPIKASTIPPSGRINMDSMPQVRNKSKGSGFEFDTQKTMKAVLLAASILLLIGLALGLKYFLMNPEKEFNSHIEQAQKYVSEGTYDKAIAEYEAALQMPNENEEAKKIAEKGLNNAKEMNLIKQGDDWYKNGDLIKAKMQYEDALLLNPTNGTLQHKIDNIQQSLLGEKRKIMASADSLLYIKKYVKAKEYLFDALYIDQKDNKILKLLNLCNNRLSQDSLTIEEAIQQALQQAQLKGTSITTKVKSSSLEAEDTPKNALIDTTTPLPKTRRRQNTDDYSTAYPPNNSYPSTSYPSSTTYPSGSSSYPSTTTSYPASGTVRSYPSTTTTTVPDRLPARATIEKIEPIKTETPVNAPTTPPASTPTDTTKK
jgi:serine/threonine protein phosphatase PrpC